LLLLMKICYCQTIPIFVRPLKDFFPINLFLDEKKDSLISF